MKPNFQFALTAAVALLFGTPLLAQDSPAIKSDRSAYARDRLDCPRGDRLNSTAKASDVLGMTVKNYQDEKLGKVEELAVDVESGRIVLVIVSVGGFLGLGNRLTGVPPGALHHDVANKVLHLEANKEKLKNVPEFKASQWAESAATQHLAAVYGYYGEADTYKFIYQGEMNDGTANTSTTRNPDGTWSKPRVTGERQWMIPASRLGHLQKASAVVGMSVKNKQDEKLKLGKVDNLILDVQSGRIVTLIISSGGFLGMNDELSAVPPTALSFNAERDTLQLDATREILSSAPHFRSSQWPDFSQPTYSQSVYQAYKVEPYFTTNVVAETDNSRRKVRDRHDRTLTPGDQGKDRK